MKSSTRAQIHRCATHVHARHHGNHTETPIHLILIRWQTEINTHRERRMYTHVKLTHTRGLIPWDSQCAAVYRIGVRCSAEDPGRTCFVPATHCVGALLTGNFLLDGKLPLPLEITRRPAMDTHTHRHVRTHTHTYMRTYTHPKRTLSHMHIHTPKRTLSHHTDTDRRILQYGVRGSSVSLAIMRQSVYTDTLDTIILSGIQATEHALLVQAVASLLHSTYSVESFGSTADFSIMDRGGPASSTVCTRGTRADESMVIRLSVVSVIFSVRGARAWRRCASTSALLCVPWFCSCVVDASYAPDPPKSNVDWCMRCAELCGRSLSSCVHT